MAARSIAPPSNQPRSTPPTLTRTANFAALLPSGPAGTSPRKLVCWLLAARVMPKLTHHGASVGAQQYTQLDPAGWQAFPYPLPFGPPSHVAFTPSLHARIRWGITHLRAPRAARERGIASVHVVSSVQHKARDGIELHSPNSGSGPRSYSPPPPVDLQPYVLDYVAPYCTHSPSCCVAAAATWLPQLLADR